MKKEESPKFEKAKRELGRRDPYVGIVLEEIQGQLSTIIEGNDTLESKIDRHYAEFCEFRIETNEKFHTLFEFRDETNKNFKTFFDYARISDEEKADKTEVAVLERRVTRLEKHGGPIRNE